MRASDPPEPYRDTLPGGVYPEPSGLHPEIRLYLSGLRASDSPEPYRDTLPSGVYPEPSGLYPEIRLYYQD
ncbi:MAG: hypothetical protein M0R21_01530 [Lentimicrobiaceae bacterium]|nr:hypothetical protein [Lentimicrobiaceae bacterium]